MTHRNDPPPKSLSFVHPRLGLAIALALTGLLALLVLSSGTSAQTSQGPGDLDVTFDPGDGADGTVQALALQPDDKVLIGGDFTHVDNTARNYIARLNSDGSLDTGFLDGPVGANGMVHAVALQLDGEVLIGGLFTAIDSTPRSHIARLVNEFTNKVHLPLVLQQ